MRTPPLRRWVGRSTAVVAIGGIALLVTACQPIVNHDDGTSSSNAQFRVHRSTRGERTGIEVRIRDCDVAEFYEAGASEPAARRVLRPWAKVVRDGTVVYTDAPRPPGTLGQPSDVVRPAGSEITDLGPGDADLVFVPMAVTGSISVSAGCTDQVPSPRPGSYDWTIGSCSLVDGACGPIVGGFGLLNPPIL